MGTPHTEIHQTPLGLKSATEDCAQGIRLVSANPPETLLTTDKLPAAPL